MELNKDARILVTGGGGFIGGHMVKYLVDSGHKAVRAVDIKPLEEWHQRVEGVETQVGDLRDTSVARQAVADSTYVINLAADMGGMGFIENNKALCMLSSLISTNVLNEAHKVGVKRFFYSSSACVYAAQYQTRADVTALKEDEAYPADPEDGYGWEKLFSERMCRHFNEDFGMEISVARYHNVYGPFGSWNGGREKAPAAVCRKIAEAVLLGRTDMEIWGDGEQTRSFTYIDDCLKGTLLLLTGDYFEPLNVGSSELVTINELVSIVEDIAGIRVNRFYNLDAPKGVRGRNSDNTEINRVFGWEPSTALRDGMATTYRWIFDEVARAIKEGQY
jgi:nucleoside-diphosphate-sugar epimerase